MRAGSYCEVGNAAQPNTRRASPCTTAKGNPRHDYARSEPQRKGAGVTPRAVFLRRNLAARSPPALPLSPAAKSCPLSQAAVQSIQQAGQGGHHALLTPMHTACAPGMGQLLSPHREGSSSAADSALLGLHLAGDGAGKIR